MFDNMQTENHNLGKNVRNNKKYILRKMGLKFHIIAFYMYIIMNFETFWT